MQILVLRGFSLAISGCPSTDFCKRQTELKNRPKKSHLSCTLMRELSGPESSTIAFFVIVITYSFRTYESISDSKGQVENSREHADILKGADEVVHGHHRLLVKDRAKYFLCRAKMKISTNPKIPCISVHWRPRGQSTRFGLNYLDYFLPNPAVPSSPAPCQVQ